MDIMPVTPMMVFVVAIQVAPPLALAVLAAVAAVRLRLPSLWWFFAAQVWAAAVPWIARASMASLMHTRMGGGAYMWLIYAISALETLVPFILTLVFLILLMRDVRRLLASRRLAAEVGPLPLAPSPPPSLT